MRIYDKEVAKSWLKRELKKTKRIGGRKGIVCFDYFTAYIDHKKKKLIPLLVKSNKVMDLSNLTFLYRELGWSVGKEENGVIMTGIGTVSPDIEPRRFLELSYELFQSHKESKEVAAVGAIFLKE